MKKLLLLITVGSFALTGCYYDNEEDLYGGSTTSTTSNDTIPVRYSTDINPMIASNCATSGCHVAGAQPPDLSDYAKLKVNIDKVKLRAIDLKTMPAAGPMSNENIAKLQKWIDAGALNN